MDSGPRVPALIPWVLRLFDPFFNFIFFRPTARPTTPHSRRCPRCPSPPRPPLHPRPPPPQSPRTMGRTLSRGRKRKQNPKQNNCASPGRRSKELGATVGYSIRLETKAGAKTQVRSSSHWFPYDPVRVVNADP